MSDPKKNWFKNMFSSAFSALIIIAVTNFCTFFLASGRMEAENEKKIEDNFRELKITCNRIMAIETRNAEKDEKWIENEERWERIESNQTVILWYMESWADKNDLDPPPKKLLKKVID